MEIVIATRNVHKVREFREILKQFPEIDVTSLLNFSEYEPPEEDGKTFQENAKIKAEHASKTLKKLVIADDSGLVVPKLNGEPGVYSRRYAGEDSTDAENRQKLLIAMKKFEELDRSAFFECALTLAGPEGVIKEVSGHCEGLITNEERGRNGFGYDPIFLKFDYDKTFGELDESTKNRISHRRKAIEKLLPTLENMFKIK